MALFEDVPVLVRGGGDLGSGVIYRLKVIGFPVYVTELAVPLFVRRAVSYGNAVFRQTTTIEGITARLVPDLEAARAVIAKQEVPVLIDESGEVLLRLNPVVVVDARMAKVNLGTSLEDAPLVIGLGPGFTAGLDCHAVIETNRGHALGRVICEGCAEADTGEPGPIQGFSHARILRAPTDGYVEPWAEIGDHLNAGALIAKVRGQAVLAPFDGVLRGLIHERAAVTQGMKIGDLDPRARREHCFTISEKSLAIGGGVVEAVLRSSQVRERLVARTV